LVSSILPVCEICGFDTKLWGEKAGFEVLKCASCGYGFVYPRPSLEELARFYGQEDSTPVQSAKMQRYRAEIPPWKEPKQIMQKLRSMGLDKGKLLDIGAGFGWCTEYFHEHGFAVTPLEPNPLTSKKIEEKTGLIVIRDFFENWTPEESLIGTFDVIIAMQVIEHVLNPQFLFQKSHDLLRQGGVLVVSTPNFNSLLIKVLKAREGHICPPEHLNFFTLKSLRLLGKRYGYRFVQGYTRSNLTRHLAIEGAKDYLRDRGAILAEITGTVAWMAFSIADRLRMGRYLYGYLLHEHPSPS